MRFPLFGSNQWKKGKEKDWPTHWFPFIKLRWLITHLLTNKSQLSHYSPLSISDTVICSTFIQIHKLHKSLVYCYVKCKIIAFEFCNFIQIHRLIHFCFFFLLSSCALLYIHIMLDVKQQWHGYWNKWLHLHLFERFVLVLI